MDAFKRRSPQSVTVDKRPVSPLKRKTLFRRWRVRRAAQKRAMLRKMLALLALCLCLPAALAAFKFYALYSLLQSATSQALPQIQASVQVPAATMLPGDLSNLDAFNLLLLGSDNDTKFADGRVLTQTDMLVRLDIKHKHVTMLSLPRDLWVRTDQGKCCAKLDEISLYETDGAKNPLDAKLHGFAHTIATIEADFKVTINAYAWVGLDGFVKVIDTLGGVDVDVLHPIVDDTYPGDMNNDDPYTYKRLFIPAGPQHLDGRTALEYVRSRHGDLLEDVGRTARQQSVLLALKKKLDVPDLLGNIDALANDLQGSVLTSLSLPQVVSLANILRDLPANAFTQYVFGLPTYGRGALVDTPEGTKWVELPNWPAIERMMRQLFPPAA